MLLGIFEVSSLFKALQLVIDVILPRPRSSRPFSSLCQHGMQIMLLRINMYSLFLRYKRHEVQKRYVLLELIDQRHGFD